MLKAIATTEATQSINAWRNHKLGSYMLNNADRRRSNWEDALNPFGAKARLVGVAWTALILAGFSSSGRAGGDDKDFLYIGDGGDNTVKRFDAQTGAFIDVFVTSDSSGKQPGEPIIGPRGIIFAPPEGRPANFVERGNHFHRELWLANQNVDQTQSGTILRYNGFNGAFMAPLVNFTPPKKRPSRLVASS